MVAADLKESCAATSSTSWTRSPYPTQASAAHGAPRAEPVEGWIEARNVISPR